MGLRLDFVDNSDEALTVATGDLIAQGRIVTLYPCNERAKTITEAIRARHPTLRVSLADNKIVLQPDSVGGESNAWTLLESDGTTLAAILMKFVDCKEIHLVTPVTDRHSSRNALFLISIPKSGTHLVYELLKAFGYHRGETAPQNPRPQHWYFINSGTPHTAAPDFFFYHPWRQHAAHMAHPFHGSPAVFGYRHPYDILLSEASWYSSTDVKGYLAGLSGDEIIVRLVNDPWLFGSLRDRIGKFAAWLSFPSVIPVSYEELVGPRGGGSAERQRALIWSLQLKLQVAGVPDEIAATLYNPRSETFRTGRAGDYRSVLPQEARRQLALLASDYLEVFGYSADFEAGNPIYPRRADEFRQRPLVIKHQKLAPLLMEQDFLGFNLVLYKDKFFAMRIADGPMDLSALDDAKLAHLRHADDLNRLKLQIFGEMNHEQ